MGMHFESAAGSEHNILKGSGFSNTVVCLVPEVLLVP